MMNSLFVKKGGRAFCLPCSRHLENSSRSCPKSGFLVRGEREGLVKKWVEWLDVDDVLRIAEDAGCKLLRSGSRNSSWPHETRYLRFSPAPRIMRWSGNIGTFSFRIRGLKLTFVAGFVRTISGSRPENMNSGTCKETPFIQGMLKQIFIPSFSRVF